MAYTILLVDDSATMRDVIKKTIQMAKMPNIGILEADNGRQALELMAQQKVNLVLADINMPEMNGIEMIERLHAGPDTCSIPVIVVSTESNQPRLEMLKTQGVVGYVHKPFTPELIRDAIYDVIGASHAKTE
jgi:two-component system, chemotaxis family, chemotaxis protein CheY